MKVTYCGCKSVMKTQQTVFPRGKAVELTDEIANKVLKIDGFFSTMTADAKKELKANEDHEALEIKKLEEGIKVVEVEVPIDNTEKLESVIKQLTSENQDLQKQLLAEQAKSMKAK